MPAKKLGANISRNPQFKPIRRMGKVVAQGWGRRWGRPGGWLGGAGEMGGEGGSAVFLKEFQCEPQGA